MVEIFKDIVKDLDTQLLEMVKMNKNPNLFNALENLSQYSYALITRQLKNKSYEYELRNRTDLEATLLKSYRLDPNEGKKQKINKVFLDAW